MGMVSLLEDAFKRFENDFHLAKKELPAEPVKVPMDEWRSVASLLVRGEKVLAEVAGLLDIATDPSIDIAHELECTVADAKSLRSKVSEFQKTSLSLASHLREKEFKLKEAREQLKKLKIENNQLNKKLERAIRENPDGVYNQFTKGASQRK
jgi:septal ring factor EnvC (AmiA/AmiB activator)